jgi:hypothetical protein
MSSCNASPTYPSLVIFVCAYFLRSSAATGLAVSAEAASRGVPLASRSCFCSEIVVSARKFGIVGQISQKLVKYLANYGGATKRTVVCTLGSLPTVACQSGGETVTRTSHTNLCK